MRKYADHLFTAASFLSTEECRALIERSEAIGYEEAPISGRLSTAIRKDVRSNDRVMVDDYELANSLWERARALLPDRYFYWVPVGLNERFRFYRYDPGQRFVWHMDGSFQRGNGDQSHVTMLIYLNDVELGGATSFKGFRIEPETGRALFFLHNYLHQGDPVIKGRKYVLRTDVMYRRQE